MSSVENGRKRLIVVANLTGGQGKTTVAYLLSQLLQSKGFRVKTICADVTDGEGKDAKSKLGRLMDGVVELGAGPSSRDIANNMEKKNFVFEYWDGLVDTLFDDFDVAVLDLGANIISRIFEWGRSIDFERVIPDLVVDIVVPVTARPKPMLDGIQVIEASAVRASPEDTGTGIDFRKTFVVLNEVNGAFDVDGLVGSAEYRDLVKAVDVRNGRLVEFPRCGSAVMAAGEQVQIGIAHFFDKKLEHVDFKELAENLSWNRARASREAADLERWVSSVRSSFEKSGMLEGRVSEADAVEPGVLGETIPE